MSHEKEAATQEAVKTEQLSEDNIEALGGEEEAFAAFIRQRNQAYEGVESLSRLTDSPEASDAVVDALKKLMEASEKINTGFDTISAERKKLIQDSLRLGPPEVDKDDLPFKLS